MGNISLKSLPFIPQIQVLKPLSLMDYQSKARRSKLVTARQCHKVSGSLFTSQKFLSGIQQKISQVERRPFFFFFFFVSVFVEKVWDRVGMKIFYSPRSLVPCILTPYLCIFCPSQKVIQSGGGWTGEDRRRKYPFHWRRPCPLVCPELVVCQET